MFTMSSRRIIYQVCLCLLGVIVSVCQQGNVLGRTNRIIAYTGWHFRWCYDLYSYLSLAMLAHLIFFEAKKMFIAKDDLNIVFKWGSTTKGIEGKDKSFRNFVCFLQSFFQKKTQFMRLLFWGKEHFSLLQNLSKHF